LLRSFENYLAFSRVVVYLVLKFLEMIAMAESYTVSGTLEHKRLIRLDEPVPLRAGKVKVTVRVGAKKTAHHAKRQNLAVTLEAIHARQRARGHQPPTAREVEAYVRQERESWGR
jgi:hypothetical protein